MHQFDTFVDKCWDHLPREVKDRWSEQMRELESELKEGPSE